MAEILGSLWFSFYKFGGEITQPENMCDIVFEKAKGRGRTVNRTSDFHKKNTCAGISFLINLDAADRQFH